MTAILSFPSTECILMFSDSAMRTETATTIGDAESSESEKYELTNKIYQFPGHGCVTIWGRLDNMQPRLLQLKHTFSGDGFFALKDRVLAEIRKLTEDDDPLADVGEPYSEVGCHVGGFVDGKPRLWHVFWGKSRPPTTEDEVPDLHNQDESHLFSLYNGRNEYVHRLLSLFLEEERAPVHSTYSPWELLFIAANIIMFISHLTREVSEPVKVAIIRPDNEIKVFTLDQIAAPPPESTRRRFEAFLDTGADV